MAVKLIYNEVFPDSNCHFEATGLTREEVAEIILKHAKELHEKDIFRLKMSEDEMLRHFSLISTERP